MNILYLGSFPTSELIAKSNGKIDSFYRDDQAIIKGLRSIDENTIRVITIPDIGSYPANKIWIDGHYDAKDGAYSLPLLNIPLLKQIWTILYLFIAAFQYIRKCKEPIAVFVPYIVFHHVIPAQLLKLCFKKRVKTVLVAPDIFFPTGIINKFLKKHTEKIAKQSDMFILYTAAMADYLEIGNKPFVVIEGFKEFLPHKAKSVEGKFVIFYAGSLNVEYGLYRLVDAMEYIKSENIQLRLYGDGNAVSYIKRKASHDNRIKYEGRVSKKVATEEMYHADVLVNPRNAEDGEYVAFSFPSKDIDYLGTGIPSVLCKLPGMPREYYSYFIDAGSGSPREIAEAVNRVYEMKQTDRNAIGMKAKDFIEMRMDVRNQGLRICEMINNYAKK